MEAFSRCLSITGALLIVGAMVAHIVCFATPNLASLDAHSIYTEVMKELASLGKDEIAARMEAALNSGRSVFDEGTSIYFGIWKVCMKASINSSFWFEACFPWGSSLPGTGPIDKQGWMDSVRGCYIAGLVFAVLAVILSNTNAHTRSQGDRRRILPMCICVTSFLTGIIVLIGSLIAAIGHNKDFHVPVAEEVVQEAPELFDMIDKIRARHIHLSWGFSLDLTSGIVFILAGLFHLLAGRDATREAKVVEQREKRENPLPTYDASPV